MSLIKSWKDFFKSKPNLDESDVRDITDIFDNFLEELLLNHDLTRNDLDFSIELRSPKVIKAYIIINPRITIRGRGGSMIVKEAMYKIFKSDEMKVLRDQIKMNYNLFDTSDELSKLKNKSGGFDIGPEASVFMIEQLGAITFTITPK